VRRIGWILLILFLLGWVASEVPCQGPEPLPATVWRRTRDGWEHRDWVLPPREPYRPALHPLVIAAMEVLLSATAMLTLSRN
jgi:hypothetical protein